MNSKYFLWPLLLKHLHARIRRYFKPAVPADFKPTDNPSAPVLADTLIVLVHGYSRTPTDWLWLQPRLAQSLKLSVCTVNLWPTIGSIQQIATSLQSKLKTLQEQTKCTQIVLVGHSMGGLVSSYLSEFMDDQHIIQKVILIGSPLHGTKLALLGYGINARQMEPDTKFLTDLLAKMQASNKSYFYVASKLDNMIIPWDSCLPSADLATKNKLIVAQLSHQSLIHSQPVLQQIVKWLACADLML